MVQVPDSGEGELVEGGEALACGALCVAVMLPPPAGAHPIQPWSTAGPSALALPYATSKRWMLTWSDEFNGPQPEEDQSCYTRSPQCLDNINGFPMPCDSSDVANLGEFNRCNWAIIDAYDYWSRYSDNTLREKSLPITNPLKQVKM